MKRREAREQAFQILFQLDINEEEPLKALDVFLTSKQNDTFLKSLTEGVITYKQELDELIAKNVENWTFSRIATAEKTILRMAVFEVKYLDDIPIAVTINEAIELANKYGDEQSGKIINR